VEQPGEAPDNSGLEKDKHSSLSLAVTTKKSFIRSTTAINIIGTFFFITDEDIK
jgi:hypothetical protein